MDNEQACHQPRCAYRFRGVVVVPAVSNAIHDRERGWSWDKWLKETRTN
jgi:hypothetical protein